MSAFTIDSYQHVLPGMQGGAGRCFEHLIVGDLLPATGVSEKTPEKLGRDGSTR